MNSTSRIVLASCFLFFSLFLASTSAQTCKSYEFANHKNFRSCNDLPALDSFIYFSYDSESGTLDLAYRRSKIQPTSWIAWAINPTGSGMIGSEALVAYRNSTTGAMHAYTSTINSYRTMLREGPLSFDVRKISAEYADDEIIIFATLVLPENMTAVNHLWQDGPVDGNRLGVHSFGGDHLRSMGTLDLLSGQVIATKGGANSHVLLVKKIHGGLNMMSWGILMPMGGIAARYMKMYEQADPLWFYTHIVCQTSGYVIGLFGGAGTAIYMAIKSNGLRFDAHSIIGIALFFLGLLQILSLRFRLDKKHKYRKYWDAYHHTTGYAVIGLSIFNIFKGIAILQSGNAWKIVYASVIGSLGVFSIAMEIVTWKRRWGRVCCTEPTTKDSARTAVEV